jgi:hypothetical protein
MAINPNIALGVQPIQQQPNMLAQYAQIMAIRAAQQETEGYEGVRNAITGGMDAGDPRMLQYGKRGIEAFRAAGEGRVKQQDALTKAYVNQRKSLDFVSTPDDLLAHGLSQFNDPVIAPQLKAQGLTPEKLTASFQRQLATEGFESLLKKRAMGLDDWYKDQTSRRNTDVSSGPGYQQAALAREKYKDQLAAGGDIVTTTVPDPENPGQRIEIQARRDMRTGQLIPLEVAPMPMRVDISPSSATSSFQPSGGGAPNVNALAPQGGAAPNVNALNPNAPQQQGPVFAMPKSTTAPTLTEVDDPANPGQKLRVDARVYKQGTTLGAPGVFGVARTENLTPAQKQKLKGEISKDFEAVQRVVGQTNELLESIDAVRSSDLERVSGPVDARTFTVSEKGKMAETRFENLKGKVTAIAKANASLGGAIGSIANQEWQILANQIAVLELASGKKPNLEQIDRLEREAMSIVNRMRDGFQRQYGTEVEALAPQYKEVPNVNYTPGQYTATGKKKSSVDNENPWLK